MSSVVSVRALPSPLSFLYILIGGPLSLFVLSLSLIGSVLADDVSSTSESDCEPLMIRALLMNVSDLVNLGLVLMLLLLLLFVLLLPSVVCSMNVLIKLEN